MPFKTKSKVYFFSEGVQLFLPSRKRLKTFITQLFQYEKKKLLGVNYIFCTDKALLNINKKFLNHDYYTDIITFELPENKVGVFGEVYISLERVRENAKRVGVTINSELHRVIFHGALHLCGYNDNTKKQELRMRRLEEHYLSLYFKNRVSRDTV